jgi:tetratricopeptide (TPR) repeat protein
VLLYELLTGTTPFDKARLGQAAYDEVRRIIREEEPPRPSTRISGLAGDALTAASARRQIEPRRLGALVRGELDWIVMTALEKDRERRYETANAVARDVERYLADQPVQAGPPSATYRLRKFARRHKAALATTGVVAVALLVALGSFGWAARDRSARRAALAQEVAISLNEAETAYGRDNLADADAAVKRAENLVAGAAGIDAIEQLRPRVRQWRLDLETVAKLEELRGSEGPITTKKPTAGQTAADLAYGDLLRQYGLDFEALEPPETARRLGASAVRRHFLAALDHWTAWNSAERRKGPAFQKLLAVAKGLDPDPWRDRLRDALSTDDKPVLAELLGDKEAVAQPPSTVLLLRATARPWHTAVPMLRAAQARHPDDFWLNYTLGQLVNAPALPGGQSVGYARVAVALRPGHFDARWNLAMALRNEQPDQAAVELREALRIRPTEVFVYSHLVSLHREMGDKAGAAAVARDMDGVKWDDSTLVERGNVYVAVGRWDDAINAYREALRLNRDDRSARDLLVGALRSASRFAELREVLRRHPD